ncbi:hypothetical protein BpHYR1_008247, partial [Brachionus plicatilis]
DIKAHFKSSNKLIQVESTTLTELINLKLDGSGSDEFLIRFQNLCDKLSRTHESDKVRLLIRAVPKRMGEELMLRQIERLDEALNVVKVMHSCMGNTSYNTDKVNMARYVGSNKSKASSNKFYHYAKNNGNRPQYYQKTDTGLKKKTYGKRDDIVCYKCNKRGHVKKDCKSKYKDKGHKGNYKKINVANALSASESSADEDQCNMAAEGKLLTSRGLIDGKPMKIAFDCGATVSIISNKISDGPIPDLVGLVCLFFGKPIWFAKK